MKRVIIPALLILLLVPFVSAGIFEWFTGNAVSECADSDGVNYYNKGEAKQGSNQLADYCIDKRYLAEALCRKDALSSEKYLCPAGCADGACLLKSDTTSDIETISAVCKEGAYQCSKDRASLQICSSGQWIKEKDCIYGCQNGGCLSQPATTTTCNEGTYQCDKYGKFVQVCKNKEWVDEEDCKYGCSGGRCLSEPIVNKTECETNKGVCINFQDDCDEGYISSGFSCASRSEKCCVPKTETPININLCIEAIPGHNNINKNRINILFVGINYNELAEPISSKDSFIFKVNKFIDINQNSSKFGILFVEPFKSNKDKFNFWYVDVIGRVEFQEPWGLDGTNVAFDEAKRLTEMCPFVNKETIVLINRGFIPVSFEGISLVPMLDSSDSSVASFSLLHEFGHSFASLTDEYIGTPPSLAGESLARNGLLTDNYSSMMVVLSCLRVCLDGNDSCCSIQTTHCFYSTDVDCNPFDNNCTSIKGCEVYYNCTSTPASIEDCERDAEWKDLIGNGCGQDGIVDCTEPICSARGVCSGGDPNYHLEVSCQNLGCGFIESYRATPNSIMKFDYNSEWGNTERSFGQNNERILCRRIRNITGSAGGICDTLCLDGCPDGQRCIQGTCHNIGVENDTYCICPAIYTPVCGSDGKIYPNSCEAGCNKTEIKCEGKCPCTPIIKECDGCLTDQQKCLPYGTRTKGLFCSLDGNLENQKTEDQQCENNFECDSNLCINNKCISKSLWDKILKFFERFL